MCNLLEISRSGYYAYFSESRKQKRNNKNLKDEELRDNILKAYKFKNRKKGARQIKMTLEKEFNIVYNLHICSSRTCYFSPRNNSNTRILFI